MKKISFILFISFSMLLGKGLVAQEDFRKTAPNPGPAPKIELGKSEQMTLKNGLKIIVVENHKLPRVSFQVFVDRPPILEGEFTGYIDMAGQMLSRGTTTRSKADIDQAVDFIGASLNASASGVSGSCLTKHQDKLLDILTDVLFNPSFPAEEFEKVKKQTLSGLAQSKDDPNFIADNVAAVLRNGKDHPYGEITTEKTIEKVTLEKCKAYYDNYFKPNISYLIITGDIQAKKAFELASQYFSKWENKTVVKQPYPTPQKPPNTMVDFVDKTGAVQSVINITYPVELKPGVPDVIKASVMNTLLGGYFGSRLMSNIREDKGYTYGASSNLTYDPVIGEFVAYAGVRNAVTDSAVTEFLKEMNRLRNETVGNEELSTVKNVMTGNFARSLERPETVARYALNVARYHLPDDYYATYLEKLSSVTATDIQEMAVKYLTPDRAHILIVGNKDEVAEKLKPFSPAKSVNFFDVYGNPLSEIALVIPDGVTAETVIADYLSALGGRDKLSGIKSVKIEMSTEIQGMSMETKMYHKAPNMLATTNSMMGNVMMQTAFDGEKGMVTQMGQPTLMEGEQLEDMKIDGHLFPERYFSQLGVKTELKGIEMIDGKKVYKLIVTYPSGSKKTIYFDVETSLKVREVEVKDGVTVTNDISDYEAVDGIKFPKKRKVSGAVPFPLIMEVKNVEVNGAIDEEVFKAN
ncbi:MAG: insulinase family protein [Saprospiraceae bacterium]|nr:insulinase family protein [Saprospiraceae bacterium]